MSRSLVPEWLSMNCVMAGMIPTMVLLMNQDGQAMDPSSIRYWGVMSLATLVGLVVAYPVNWWLVANHLKHGMGTIRALGKGGHSLDAEREREAALTRRQSAPTPTAQAGMAEMKGM